VEVLDSLCRLVDKSLLTLEQTEGSARYRMLESIREYAFERLLESDEVAGARSRFMDYFLALSREAEHELSGPAQGEWLARLDIEHENLRAALAWNAGEEGLGVAQLRLALALSRFWLVRGHWEEGITCLERVIASEGALPLAMERSKAMNTCGNLACQLGRYGDALKHYEQSLKIRRDLGAERGIAATLNNMGMVLRHQGAPERAMPLFEEALQLFRDLGQEGAVATCLNNLAAVQGARGDYPAAERNAREALQMFRVLGDQLGVAAALGELGKLAKAQREAGRAQSCFEESLALSRGLGEKIGIVDCLQNLGDLLTSKQDYEKARALYEESLAIAQDVSAAPYLAAAQDALARLNQAEALTH
jgi:tetratricopeptide (TPR) repeat protein